MANTRMVHRASLAFLTALAMCSPAYAGVVWDNGVPASVTTGGSEMSDTLQAEDFRLTGTTNLTGIEFWNLQASSADYTGSIFWEILGNGGTLPNSTVYGSGTATPTQTAAGTVLGYNQYDDKFTISVSGLAAGTYWLALHNGALTSTAYTDFYWTWAELGGGSNGGTNAGAEQQLSPLAGFSTNDDEHAFNLTGTVSPAPEPGTIGMMLAALGGLTLLRRRKIASRLSAFALSGIALFGQQGQTLVLSAVGAGESDTLYNLSLRATPSTLALPFEPAEVFQKHGPLLEDTGSLSEGLTAATSTVSTQTVTSRPLNANTVLNFEGPGTGMSGFSIAGAPPDPTIAVGPNHIVAWVNSQYAIFDKSGTKLLGGNGFVNGNTLFTGMGNLCESTNRGDPILAYDKLADRWILTQFAFGVNSSGSPISPYLQCIAVSTTNNPLGTFYRYSVDFSSVGFNDYGKLGVWPDAYYTTYNIFGGSPAGNNTGVAMCASDRTAMLAGSSSVSTLCAPVTYYAGGAAFLPGDLDGSALPPQNDGGLMIRLSTAPALRLMKLKPDFTHSTVTISAGPGTTSGSYWNISLTNTKPACNGSGGTCVKQPGTTTTLDTLGDRLMYRFAYRNRGGVESLLVTHSVDPDGAGSRSSVVRWYEIRSPYSSNGPTLFQAANYDPDGTSDRWMSSAAMDKMGNILMGYSVVNAASGMKPSIALTGRLRTDLRNQMQGERIVWTGSGSQTTRSSGTALTRWGDYTTMRVDPADDCTFWYINQYLPSDGVFNWGTRISSAKFNGCQ